jgi:hypothetical protein
MQNCCGYREDARLQEIQMSHQKKITNKTKKLVYSHISSQLSELFRNMYISACNTVESFDSKRMKPICMALLLYLQVVR